MKEKKGVNRKKRMFFVLLFLTFMLCASKTVFASGGQTCTVTFHNTLSINGVKPATAQKIVKKNSFMVLPAVPTVVGYQNLGWTIVKNGQNPLFKQNAKVKIGRNVTLYAVRKKVNHTVSFYHMNGVTNNTFRSLTKSVPSNGKITLPSVPKINGYVGVGWTNVKYGTAAKFAANKSYVIKTNVKLYAVYKKEISVVFHKFNGTVLKKVTVLQGGSLQLPGTRYNVAYTMLGWSGTKGKMSDPDYEIGEVMKNITRTTHLYEVVYGAYRETNLAVSRIPQINTEKYQSVIFVGDSRMVRLYNTLSKSGYKFSNNTYFVAKSGLGLDWFKSVGYKQMMNIVEKNNAKGIKTAIVFNTGVNDLKNLYMYNAVMNQYISCMKTVAGNLTGKKCELYYLSVNPVCRTETYIPRPESLIRAFNYNIRKYLCSGVNSSYTYIDCYNYLMKTGFSTIDGIHYTDKTSKKIYSYCILTLNQ